MSYWVESSDDQKDIWHWIGLAVAMATKIGLHQDPDQLMMQPSEKHQRKRIWWSLFMRDRLVSLAMRRYTQLSEDDCNVPLLEVDDFDIQALPEDLLLPTQSAFPRDVHRQMQIAQLCIEEVKLCVIIGHLLRVQYSTVWIDQGTSMESQTNTKTTMALMPSDIAANASEIGVIDQELSSWASTIPDNVAYQLPNDSNLKGHANGFLVHRATLSMLYHTAVNVHNRPLSRIDPTFFSVPPTLFAVGKSAFQKTRTAASTITQTAAELLSLDLIKFLQPVGVTVVVSAAMAHLGEASLPNGEIRQYAISRLSQSMAVLAQLREVYVAGDLACHLLSAGIQKAGIELPSWPPNNSAGMTPSDPIGSLYSQHHGAHGNASEQARESSIDSSHETFDSFRRVRNERSSEEGSMATQVRSDYSNRGADDNSFQTGVGTMIFDRQVPPQGFAYEVGALTEDQTLFEYANELEQGMEWMSQMTKF